MQSVCKAYESKNATVCLSERLMADSSTKPDHESKPQDAAGPKALPPNGLRLLCVSVNEPSWISLTLQLDGEGSHEPQFRWASTSTEALSILRDQSFDCVVINDQSLPKPRFEFPAGPTDLSHRLDPTLTETVPDKDTNTKDTIDAPALVRAIRASGCDDPIVMLMIEVDDEAWIDYYQQECELLVARTLWESRSLVPTIKRAIARTDVLREYRRLSVANRRRQVRERDEADHLLEQQRQMVGESGDEDTDFGTSSWNGTTQFTEFAEAESEPNTFPLPSEVIRYYQELLRTYVIMGSGNLGAEIAKLAELLSVAGLSPRQTLHLHLQRVEELVKGLGNRSTRHVMARADLLALELMIHLGESYRQKASDQA